MNCKLTLFGDSVAKGLYTENGKILQLEYPAAQSVGRALHVSLDNRSAYGQTLSRLCSRGFVESYIAAKGADRNIAAICLGGNDADFNWKEVADSPSSSHESKTSLVAFRQKLTSVVSALRGADVEVYIVSIAPVDSELYFNNVISKIADGNAVMQFFNGDISNISRHQECFNNAAESVALRTGCKFLDFRTPMLMLRNMREFYCADGIHPNKLGQDFIARQILCQIAATA